MTEDVLITVTGLHAVNGEKDAEDKVEITSAGKYYKKNGKHFVLYDEVAEETGDIIKNRLKLSDSAMEIHKTGPMRTSMVFENGKKNMSWYGTPYGNMLAGIEVTGMDVQESEDLIDVNIDYILEMNYEHVSDAAIHIRIMAKDSGLFRLM